MLMLDTWEQSATFNPADPTQKKIEKYAGIPGQYASFYFNRVPTPGQLKGPFTSAIGTGAGITIGVLLGTIMIGAGMWGLRKAGVMKGRLRFEGLSGRRRRR